MFEKVKKILAEQLMIEEDTITMESDMVSDLGADSLDLVQLLIIMEKEYKITFTDEEIKSIKTVADVVGHIEKSLS